MTSLFASNDKSMEILNSWWSGLEQVKGERALLRRAKSPSEVVFCPAFHRLLKELGNSGSREAIAAVAGLVAHVKGDSGPSTKLAGQMAAAKKGGSTRVSGLRFRRLLTTTNRNDLYPSMIRVITMLDGNVNLQDLAQSIYWWNERTRKQWAYEYYAAAPQET